MVEDLKRIESGVQSDEDHQIETHVWPPTTKGSCGIQRLQDGLGRNSG